MPATFEPAPDAAEVIEANAAPDLPATAQAIASAIPPLVPVHHGGARKTYFTSASDVILDGGHPTARVYIDSPFWHFLEYGTRFSVPYRPIQRAVTALGLRYEPS